MSTEKSRDLQMAVEEKLVGQGSWALAVFCLLYTSLMAVYLLHTGSLF